MINGLPLSNELLSQNSNNPIIHIIPSNEIQNKEASNRIQIFQKTKSGSINIKSQFKNSNSGNIKSYRSFRRKSKTYSIPVMDFEELYLKDLYKNIEEDNDVPKLIQKFTQVKDCSILIYGLKPSNEDIEFSFCRTCDPNLINPICSACIKICHIGHQIKKKFKKGRIKCICGERMHCISKNPDLTINNTDCQLGEWFIISKLNFYFETKDNNCYCMLCYNFCNSDKNKEKIKQLNSENSDDKNYIPICCCNNDEVHQDRKAFFEKMEEVAQRLDDFDYFNLLHPTQIINMIFLSKKSFEINYVDLNNLNHIIFPENFADSNEFNSFKKADFALTNSYLIFKNLLEFIKWNKYANITYYCKEVEQFFSFKRIKIVYSLMSIMKDKEKSFWTLSANFLKLFHKIYIGNLTQPFSKFKLNDLENFSCYLRWLCCNLNEKNFQENQEIIKYFLSILKNINSNGFSCLEIMDTTLIIIQIFKKMALYNLISNGDMIRIIQEIEKTFFNIKSLKKIILKDNRGNIANDKENHNERRMSIVVQKNFEILSEKELKLCYIVIKLILYFHFCFNDRLIHNVLSNDIKYPSLDSINKDTVLFSFIKTDLGRALIKLNIRVIYILQNDYKKYSKDEKYKNSMNQGMRILSYFLEINDTYLLNLMQSLKMSDFYKENGEQNEDLDYLKILKEKNKLENCYKSFFKFELDINNLIQEVENSLLIVLLENNENNNNENKNGFDLKNKKNFNILKSRYYFSLSRIFQILNFVETKNERLANYLQKSEIITDNEESIYNLVNKIIIFYKNFIKDSSDNSLLLMSNYVFKNLCKAPIKFSLNNFDLFLDSIKNIINNSRIIPNINNYIKNLFFYLEYLRNKLCSTINECLLKYLNIVELLILNIKSLNTENTIYNLKGIMINLNEEYKILEIFLENISKNKEDDINEKTLLIFTKIINNIFDFTNEKDKKRVTDILKPEKIINSLQNYNIKLNLRTEFIKYIRKIYIDLSYNEKSNQIYANTIISIDDNLLLLKTNPLISNLRYPTKLLSFLKDFLNLSIRSEINEKSNQTNIKNPNKNYTFKLENKNKENADSSIIIQNNNNNNSINIQEEDEEKEYDSKPESIKSSGTLLYSQKSPIDSSSLSSNKETFKPCFDNNIYQLLINELKNIKEITSEIKLFMEEEMEILRNYFENGLLIPIIYFLKRTFAFSHCLTGKEMLKLYELIIESCNLRLYIAEFKYDFWKEMVDTDSILEENEINIFNINEFDCLKEEDSFCRIYNNKRFMINGSFCINNNLNNATKSAINILKAKKFLCFDYTFLYGIFDQNIYSLLKDRKINKYKEYFTHKEKSISLKNIKKEEYQLFPNYKDLDEIKKRIIRLYLLYKNSKTIISNENNSSLFSILPEICLQNETNYRYLLITFLIKNGIKMNFHEDKYLFLLYKLISLQTSETQNILINIIGENGEDKNNLGFILNYADYLFKKIILLFIELFNPPDKLLDINFAFSLLLIKIFKYLCEEHNNFFQFRFLKCLNYKYVQITPAFYKETLKDEESIDEFKKNKLGNDNTKDINFFFFYLHVILKIILISEWNKFNDENEKQHKYLYDIFESILEMLNEIIQGNKPECLNILGNYFIEKNIDDNENKEKLIDEIKSKLMYNSKSALSTKALQAEKPSKKESKKIDTFQYFIKNVTNFIFNDKSSNELLYNIRNNLMQFFTTILEEKNCGEEVQKYIIKYININRVFYSISYILKAYYLKNSENDMDTFLKTIKGGFNLHRTSNFPKRQSNPQFLKISNYDEFFRITSTNNFEKNNTKIKYLDFSTKLIPTMRKDFIRTRKRQKDKKVIFNEKLYAYYNNLYYSNKEFNQTNEFKLANAFYKYIKLITVLNKSDEAKALIEEGGKAIKHTIENENKENIKKLEILEENKFDNKLNKNFSLFSFGRKKTIKATSKFTENNKLNNSELIDLNINKFRAETEKNILFPFKNFSYNNKKGIKLTLLINENENEYDKTSIEHYYIIKFFESITTTVEVRTEGEMNHIVIFTPPPEIKYLSNGRKSEFERKVNRDSEISKKNDLVRNAIFFQKEIKYYQRNQSRLSRWVGKIDFFYIQIGSYIYALFFNLLILFTLNGDNKITSPNIEEENIKSRRINSIEIQSLIDNSIYNWGKIYDIICYLYIILNGISIFLWIYFRMPLFYRIDRIKYMEENNIQNKKQLKYCQKLYIIFLMTIYERDNILILIYELIFSIVGAFMERGEMIYAFLLLPIIDLNNILKNIIVSMRLQFNEVCLTFFFASVIIYVFSNIAYFFFKKDFQQEIEYTIDNVCDNLIFCFLNALNSGLRARGGIGDSAIRISYETNKYQYIKRLIVDDIFFLLIVITAIDLVFGIIIGAFSSLRNEEQKFMNDKRKHCFICHVNKNTLEKNRENFNEHRYKIHNLWNYAYYMITLKFSNPHDLNAINSYAIQKIENKDISWLPTYKDLNIKGKNRKNDEFEENLKVEEENINKYFIKTF